MSSTKKPSSGTGSKKGKNKGQGSTGQPKQPRARTSTVGFLRGDPADHGPAGPPADGAEKFLSLITNLGQQYPLHIANVPAGQSSADGSSWWDTAGEYLERVAYAMQQRPDLFPSFRFTAGDLLTRKGRVEVMGRVVVQLGLLQARLMATLNMERADAVTMADTAMQQLDATSKTPSTAQDVIDAITEIAGLPLDVWRQRQGKIQQTKNMLGRLRDENQAEIEDANQRADAAEAAAKIRAGVSVPTEAALLADGQGPPPAPKTRRGTPRG